jgi:hypothetical protein
MTVVEIDKAIEELKTEVQASQSEPAPEVRSIIDAFESIRTELQLERPNLSTLAGLLAEAQACQDAIAREMIDGMRSGWVPTPFGTEHGAAKVKQVFDALAAEIVEIARRRTADFNELAGAAADAIDPQVTLQVNEHLPPYQVQEKSTTYAPQDWIVDMAETLTAATSRLNEAVVAHPEAKRDFLPILEQLLALSMRAIAQRHDSAAGHHPPRGPIDTSPERGDDDGMEPRIVKLEQFAEEARKDLRSIDVRLAKVETLADGIAKNMATKADIFQLESTLLKWFVGTAIAVAGLGFAAAKFLH